jgi:serine/threonine-protein kinase
MGFLIWRERTAGSSGEQVKSLAVLPFKPLAAQERDESLELGMADTLIMKLGSNAEITVRPLTAVRRFDALDQDAVEAGKALGVDAVIEGNIQSAGGRVRVAAKLIRIRDGKQLWAGQFDESSTDIFAIQDSISQRAAEALRVALGTQGRRRYTDNIEAYGLYMKGRFHILRLVRPEVEKGISYFEQAISIDPNYTLSYIGLANAYRALVLTSDARPIDLMPKGKKAAAKAVELDPELAQGWAALGSYSFWYDFDRDAAERQYKKAIELDPNDAEVRFLYSHMLSNAGRHDEAQAEVKRAREIDPVSILGNAIEGQILFFAGRDEEALRSLQAAGEMDQNFWLVPLFTTRVYLHARMYDEAVMAARKASQLSGGNAEAEALIGYALALSGRRNEAVQVLTRLEERAKSGYVPSYDLAFLHLALGEGDEAVSLLEKAFDNHEAQLVFLKVDPKWDELREDPRFLEIMRRINF